MVLVAIEAVCRDDLGLVMRLCYFMLLIQPWEDVLPPPIPLYCRLDYRPAALTHLVPAAQSSQCVCICLLLIDKTFVKSKHLLFIICWIFKMYIGKVKSSCLAYNWCETQDKRPLGRDLKPFWSHEQRSKRLYPYVAVTLAPVRVPTQRLLVLSFTSVVG